MSAEVARILEPGGRWVSISLLPGRVIIPFLERAEWESIGTRTIATASGASGGSVIHMHVAVRAQPSGDATHSNTGRPPPGHPHPLASFGSVRLNARLCTPTQLTINALPFGVCSFSSRWLRDGYGFIVSLSARCRSVRVPVRVGCGLGRAPRAKKPVSRFLYFQTGTAPHCDLGSGSGFAVS